MLFKPIAAAAALFAASSILAAQPADMPDYNVDRHCKQMSDLTGGSNFMLEACLKQEQNAYDQLKGDWASLDRRIKAHCREMARVTAPSYFMLNACVAQEIRSSEAVGNFKFQK